ncbi:MAG: hypothetical protein DLM72_19370 [Candidatus Nitrosopolaris wilkensis]|nr:MAG: hypothetical protein DLM72_19370 [Candidatus Nitrosopolaris wilkensis]
MNRRTKYVSLQKPQSEIILHIIAYPRNKFKCRRHKCKCGKRLHICCKLFATKELTLKVLKQIKNTERIVNYAVKADFTFTFLEPQMAEQ